MSKLAYLVDDSALALKINANAIQSYFKDIELKTFRSGTELIEALKLETQPIFAVFSDVNMPNVSGHDVCSWVKRNPKRHATPVIMVTAELEEKEKAFALKNGASAYLEKPLKAEDMTALLDRLSNQSDILSRSNELDLAFCGEVLETVDTMHKLLVGFNDDKAKEIYRGLHTVKGGANSLQFPQLGQFVHTAEAFLSTVRQAKLFGAPQVTKVFQAIFGFIEAQAENIRSERQLEIAPIAVMEDIRLILANVAAGWSLPGAENSGHGPVQNHQSAPSGAAGEAGTEEKAPHEFIVSRNASSVRIANEKLDDLQVRFKKILQTRNKISSFAMQLHQEFSDEAFPKDLAKLVEDLKTESSEVMEFFIALRVTPVSRIKNFAQRVVAQTAETTEKLVRLEFESEKWLEVDQSIQDALEAALTHILRNSVDHGIEKSDDRKMAGKDDVGVIKINIHRKDDVLVEAIISDDGGGIRRDKLKQALVKKGVLTQEQADRMTDSQALDLVFVDGLSTRTEVSDISGRGVGLGAVKDAIEKMGGKINVFSEIGKGSEFRIQIPRIFRL